MAIWHSRHEAGRGNAREKCMALTASIRDRFIIKRQGLYLRHAALAVAAYVMPEPIVIGAAGRLDGLLSTFAIAASMA
jgi:hypothetical protein